MHSDRHCLSPNKNASVAEHLQVGKAERKKMSATLAGEDENQFSQEKRHTNIHSAFEKNLQSQIRFPE